MVNLTNSRNAGAPVGRTDRRPRKVLLLNARSMETAYLTAPTLVPSGLQELFFYLRDNGVETRLVDFDLHEASEDTRRLLEWEADIIGISTGTSYRYLHALDLIRTIRREFKDATKIFVGGTHASALPLDFLSLDPKVRPDYVVIGAGEHILLDAAHGRDLDAYRTATPNVLCDGRAECSVPFIRYDFTGAQSKSELEFCPSSCTVVMNLSRGCVGKCTFCVQSVSGICPVALDLDHALAVIESLDDLPSGIRAVFFSDPCFGFNPTWRHEILIALKRHKHLDIGVMARMECLNQTDVELLADSRITVDVGFESFCPRMLRIMNKTRTPEMYVKRAREFISRCCDANVHLEVNLLFNHPGETPASAAETLGAIRDLHGRHGRAFQVVTFEYGFFPGTRVFQRRGFYRNMEPGFCSHNGGAAATTSGRRLARACPPTSMGARCLR
jgi:radical SAM superfamily enzyme YgiQ (UPF0313 family)